MSAIAGNEWRRTARCFLLVLLFRSVCFGQAPADPFPAITESEKKELEEVVARFTERLLKEKDLEPLMSDADLFVSGSIERYNRTVLAEGDSGEPVELYGFGGLRCDRRLLATVGPGEWRRLYAGVHTLMFLGVAGTLAEMMGGVFTNIQVFPSSVVQLLGANAHLADLLQSSGAAPPIQTPEELAAATAVLRAAGERMRQERSSEDLKAPEVARFVAVLRQGESLAPKAYPAPEGFHGLRAGRRVLWSETPLGLGLDVIKEVGGYRILWAGGDPR